MCIRIYIYIYIHNIYIYIYIYISFQQHPIIPQKGLQTQEETPRQTMCFIVSDSLQHPNIPNKRLQTKRRLRTQEETPIQPRKPFGDTMYVIVFDV